MYNFVSYVQSAVLPAAKVQQTMDNIRDHTHGVNSVNGRRLFAFTWAFVSDSISIKYSSLFVVNSVTITCSTDNDGSVIVTHSLNNNNIMITGVGGGVGIITPTAVSIAKLNNNQFKAIKYNNAGNFGSSFIVDSNAAIVFTIRA